MLLLQTIKRFIVDRDVVTEEWTAYATNLPISEALTALREYEEVYQRFYKTAVTEHRLMGVQSLPDELGPPDLAHGRLFKIEDLLRDLTAIEAQMISEGRA